MTPRLSLSLIPVLFLIAGNAGAAPAKPAQPDVRSLFNQFAISAAAARQCSKPSKEAIDHFNANYRLVAVATSREIAKRHPDMNQQQIADAMKKQADILSQRVANAIKEKGCKDPEVTALVQRFDAEAKWDPRKQAQNGAQPEKAKKK